MLFALVGLVTPPAAVLAVSLTGIGVPVVIPAVVGVGLGLAMSFLPYYNVADGAKRARAEFSRAMTCYIDLVALERAAGAGPVQALEHAAAVGDSWVFHRLRDELARSRYRGTSAWEALRAVGEELRLPELVQAGDVMRLAAVEGATVYDNLRARAHDMRNELLTQDKAAAGVRTERASAPVAMTTIVFLLIFATPLALTIV
ncbi:type II secretion system F family protein [Phytoactinopolyspora mesophila]|uniref:type II secretion system F family protein n=1 Tax=Phytoactinopolyspora mesophila TaxID=2650750 RepID=UPI001391CABC